MLLVSIGFNLSSGFNDFVNETEDKHIKDSITQLAAVYQKSNSWQAIRDNVQIWRDIVDPRPTERQSPPQQRPRNNSRYDDRPMRDAPPPRRGDNRNANPPPQVNKPAKSKDSPSDFLKTGRRMSLYDRDKNVIEGRTYLDENPRIEAIIVAGKTVGWIGLVPSNAIKDSPASEFLRQQYQIYYWLAGAVLLISIFMAIVLARHLAAPIKQLINGTSKLRSGDFEARIRNYPSDEIGTLSDNFNDLANTLQKNKQNRQTWMSDTSHELRTPLTVIKSQLIAIQDGVLEASESKLSLLVDEIDKLNRIVDDLYQLSSSDVGGLTYKKHSVEPLKLLHQTLDNYQSKFEQQSLTVTRNFAANAQCSIVADKDRLLQLFSNLLENSCRYTDQGGKINVVASFSNEELRIQIQDSAPGVLKQDQIKLFERFYRVEKSRSRIYGGSGLGLALCSQIVEAHQGTICAQDSPLGGLSISITLPIKRSV